MHILVSVHTNTAIQQIVSQILQRFQMSMTIKGILRHNLRLLCQVWLTSPLFSCRLMSACLWEMWFHIDQLVICQITLTVLFILQIKILQNHAGSQGCPLSPSFVVPLFLFTTSCYAETGVLLYMLLLYSWCCVMCLQQVLYINISNQFGQCFAD